MTKNSSGTEHGSDSRQAHLRDYGRIVWQSRYTVLAVFVAVVGLTFLRVSFSTPIYEAKAIVQINPEARRILPGQEQWVGAEGGGWLAEEKYFNTQLEVLRSRDIAERTFRQLHLENHPLFKRAKDPIAAFASLIEVEPKINTRLVTVKVSSPNPKEAQEWVNAVVDVYVKRNVDQATASFHSIMDEIGHELSLYRANLGAADLDRMKSAADAELLAPETQQEVLHQSLATYNEGLAKLHIEIATLRAEVDSYEKAKREGGDLLAVASISKDPTIQDLVLQRQAAEKELRQIGLDKKPGHPEYVSKLAEIEKVKERIREQADAVYDKLRTQLGIDESNEAYLTQQIQRTEQEAYRVKRASASYEMEKADAATQRKVYDIVAETMNRLTVGAQLVSMNNNVSVLDRAIEPRNPVRPRKLLSVGVGSLLGLLMGVVAVLFLDYLDNTVRSPDDVEQYLGLGILGIVPKYSRYDDAAVREAFQSLRTSILFSSHNRDKNVLLMTSAGPQEGKSSTVALAARALASAGDRVIILDCDLRRPTQHQLQDVSREPGITNYLIDGQEGDYEHYVQSTDLPTLRVFASGVIPPNPPELIGLAKFQKLIETLKRTYDWVVIDSPPVSALADSVVLASMADLMVMVIKHNQNDRDLIRRSLKRLGDIGIRVTGAVLNAVDLQKTTYGNYYYAGYHYEAQDKGPRRRRGPVGRPGSPGGDRKLAL